MILYLPKKTCRKCGKQVKDDVSSCPNCGCSSFEQHSANENNFVSSNKTFCRNCGQQMDNNEAFCKNCGQPMTQAQYKPAGKKAEIRCLPSFILGVLGSTFGLLGGICTTMCSVFNSNSAFLWIVGGSLVGMIGACLCFKKTRLGSILELVGSFMIIYRAYFDGGADLMSVVALLLLLFGGLIGAVYSFIIKRK